MVKWKNKACIIVANQQSLSGLSKFGDLKKRLTFLLGALVVFRIGAHIPVPGVDAVALAKLYESAGNGILGMLNMFSGGSLERFSVFAIGIMPYISASIIVQLASEIIPSLKALKKEGEAGRKVITKYTRYGTVLLKTEEDIKTCLCHWHIDSPKLFCQSTHLFISLSLRYIEP